MSKPFNIAQAMVDMKNHEAAGRTCANCKFSVASAYTNSLNKHHGICTKPECHPMTKPLWK